MLSDYPNLKVDISWVVWEDVICDENGKVKQGWIDCIQKHHTRFYIGSDNVAQACACLYHARSRTMHQTHSASFTVATDCTMHL